MSLAQPAAEARTPHDGFPDLRRNRDFLLVFVGQSVSWIGDAVSFTALPILVLFLTGSGAAMGIVGALQTVPDLLLGVAAGAYVDRWDRRRTMLVADFGRAAMTALIPVVHAVGGPTLIVLLLVIGPISVLRIFFTAAYLSAVPSLVGKRRLPAATAAFEATWSFGFVVGPAIAGALAAAMTPAFALAVDAASFLVSALTIAAVTRPLSTGHRAAEPRRLVTEIRNGISFVVRHPVLRLAVGLWSLYQVLASPWAVVLLYYMTVDRGLGPDAYGLVIAAYGVGSLAGSPLGGRLAGRYAGRILIGGIALTGVVAGLSATQASLAVLSALLFIGGLGEVLASVAATLLRADLTPDHMLGRVTSLSRTIGVGGQSLGYLLAGVLLERLGGTVTLLIWGLLLLAIGVVFSLPPSLRVARTTQSSPAAAP
jgi:MFS family permease